VLREEIQHRAELRRRDAYMTAAGHLDINDLGACCLTGLHHAARLRHVHRPVIVAVWGRPIRLPKPSEPL
jgi:hypothetical protein